MELAATRFMYWMTFFAVDLMWIMMFIRTHKNGFNPLNWTTVETMMVGFGIAGLSLTIQQWFWWVNEHLTAVGDCKFKRIDPGVYDAAVCARRADWYSYADWTMALYFTAVFGAALIVNGVVAEIISRASPRAPRLLWLVLGNVFALVMWMTGYALVWFRVGT